MTHPYPPPTTATPPQRRQFSKWWPISFFIATIVLYITAGALIGVWSTSTHNCAASAKSYSSYKASCGNDTADGRFYAAIACFVLGVLCKLTGAVLLLVWCAKRAARYPAAVSYSYTYQPLGYAAAPAAPAAPAPVHQDVPPYRSAAIQEPCSREPAAAAV
jgi:hypothetical protein